MVNTVDPNGSVRYEADASSPSGYRQVSAYSPDQQAINDGGNRAQIGALHTANDQIGRIDSALGQTLAAPTLQQSVGPTDFTADREAVTDAIYGRAKSRLDPEWEQAEAKERGRLSNQGLSQNSTAYTNSLDAFGRAKNDAYEGARSSAIQAGTAEQNQLFNQKLAQGDFANSASQMGFQNNAYAQDHAINQFATLLGTSDNVQMPAGFSGSTPQVAGTDLIGAVGINANQQNSAYQARAAQQSAKNQALGNIAGSAITYFSERSLKRDINKIGERPDGISIYSYRYNDDADDAPVRFGVMADEVEAVKPDAVSVVDGYRAVDYGML